MSSQRAQPGEAKKLPWFGKPPRGFTGRFGYAVTSFAHKDFYENVAALLDLKPSDDVLDIACGNGHFLRKHASHVRSIAGLDLSKLGIELAARKNADRVAAGTADFICSDASKLPWGDGKFSAATLMGSPPFYLRPLQTLKEMYRVLRPGGRAVLNIEMNAEDGRDYASYVKKYGYHILTEAEVQALAKKAGFSRVDITYAKAAGMPKIMLVKASK